MTIDECDQLLDDLLRVEGDTYKVRVDADKGYKVSFWCRVQERMYWIDNAQAFRYVVRMGWIPHIPSDAFDKSGRHGDDES